MPSGNVTVADPSVPTSTFVALGFAPSTAFLTASFSGWVKDDVFWTGVLVVGALTPLESASLTVLSPVRVAVEPSSKVTVAAPSVATSTFVAFGFTALTAASTEDFSSSVKAVVFLTGTLFVGAWMLAASFSFSSNI